MRFTLTTFLALIKIYKPTAPNSRQTQFQLVNIVEHLAADKKPGNPGPSGSGELPGLLSSLVDISQQVLLSVCFPQAPAQSQDSIAPKVIRILNVQTLQLLSQQTFIR